MLIGRKKKEKEKKGRKRKKREKKEMGKKEKLRRTEPAMKRWRGSERKRVARQRAAKLIMIVGLVDFVFGSYRLTHTCSRINKHTYIHGECFSAARSNWSGRVPKSDMAAAWLSGLTAGL